MNDNSENLRAGKGKVSFKQNVKHGGAASPDSQVGSSFHAYMVRGSTSPSLVDDDSSGGGATGGAPAKKEAGAVSVECPAMAAGIEGNIPVSVYKRCEQDWDGSGHPFSLKRLLRSYQEVDLEGDSDVNICDSLCRGLPGRLLFLHDHTGIGVHLLGMHLISEWEQGNALTDYEQLLWLPYNQIVTIWPDAHRQVAFSIKPEDLMALMGSSNIYDPEKKTLLVVTGIDKVIRLPGHQEELHATILGGLAPLFRELPCLMIGNYKPEVLSDLDMLTKDITLPPIYSAISQTYPFERQEPTFLGYLGGGEVSDGLSHLMQRAFYFHGQEARGVVTFTEQIQGSLQQEARLWLGSFVQRSFPQHFRSKKSRSRSRASSTGSEGSLGVHDVPERQSPWTSREHVSILTDLESAQANPPCAMPDAISNPAQWYLAARRRREGSEVDTFAVYHVSGHAIAVRSRNSYVTDLGPSNELQPQKLTGTAGKKVRRMHRGVRIALEAAKLKLSDPSFTGDVVRCFKKEDGCYISKDHRKAHDLLEITPRAVVHAVMLQKESDLTYPAIQQELLSRLGSLAEDTVTQAIRAILHGTENLTCPRELRDICRLLVSVLMFGEVAREEKCFFALFAMISLVSDPDFSYTWRRFVALPEQLAIRTVTSKSWINYVTANAAGSLGGIHPMAHNGSFNQVSDVSPVGSYSWPDIKMQMLYLSFVKQSINRDHRGEFMSLQASMVLGTDFSEPERSPSRSSPDYSFSGAHILQPRLIRQFSDEGRATPLPDGFDLVKPLFERSSSDPARVEESSEAGRQVFVEFSPNRRSPQRPFLVRECSEDSCGSDTIDTLEELRSGK